MLHQFERRQETLRQQLVKRLDRLDERVDRALAQAQQNAALLAGSRGRRSVGHARRTARSSGGERSRRNLELLLCLSAPRVLELRPRFGAIGAAIRRQFGGETFALPLFEAQQLVVREIYGTRADGLLDCDREVDVQNAQPLPPADVRRGVALARGGGAGFRTVFATKYQGNCVVLAQLDEPRVPLPPSSKTRGRRLERYAAARDRSILMLPPALCGHFREEWGVTLDEKGSLRLNRGNRL